MSITMGAWGFKGPLPMMWGNAVSSPHEMMVSTARQPSSMSCLCTSVRTSSEVSGAPSWYRTPFLTVAFLISEIPRAIARSVFFCTACMSRISSGIFFARTCSIVPASTTTRADSSSARMRAAGRVGETSRVFPVCPVIICAAAVQGFFSFFVIPGSPACVRVMTAAIDSREARSASIWGTIMVPGCRRLLKKTKGSCITNRVR